MAKTIAININGRQVEADEGVTVLRAAEIAGITIPTLCDHPDLEPFGGCRLCVVEVKGWRTPMASCTLEVTPGMEITTESRVLRRERKAVLSLLLSCYFDDGYRNTKSNNELLHWSRHYGLNIRSLKAQTPRYAVDSDPNPFLFVDLNKCILCTRCIRACNDIQGRSVWSLAERGIQTHIVSGADTDLISARCESCGACVAYCPTGALDNKMSMGAGKPDRLVTTTCTYCGVGCQLDLNVKNERVIWVTSNPKGAVNGMHLCVKGRYGYDFIHHKERLLRPRVRKYLLENTPRPADRGEWVDVDWKTALGITARELKSRRDQHGGDSIGVLTSAKCLNEENYLMNKFARQVMGTHNIDHCARL